VKTPEKWRAVVGQMPVIESQVHQQKTGDQLKPRWKGEKVDKTKRPFSGPAQCPLGCRLDQSNGCEKRKSAETATFTRRRVISEWVPFRRGKERSRTNNSAKSATAASVVATAFKSPV
jgi:hypothetical protein